jgi:hypothetical protein
VEILQVELAMKKLAGVEGVKGQLASAYLLAGIVYELLDEQSDALISYRDAAQIIEKRGLSLPLGLKQALLRMSFKLGIKDQYLAYQAKFPELPLANRNNKNQLFALYFDGVVSHKIENSIIVPNFGNEQLIRISMPAYPQLNKPIDYVKISQENVQIISELVDDIDVLAREDLEKEYASILLLTTTRAIGKYNLVKNAQKQNLLLGIFVNIVTLLTEQADLRSWNMLPATIQFAYLEPLGNEVVITGGNIAPQKIVIAEHSKNILLINNLSKKIFQYQQR